MAALMRGLLSKFSHLNINCIPLRQSNLESLHHAIAPCVFQSHVLGRSSIRMLRANNSDNVNLKSTAKFSAQPKQEVLENQDDLDAQVTKETLAKVNNQIVTNSHGRLFAVIHIAGKQRRVTDGDLIMVEGDHPTKVGDVIRAEKVLLLGSRDFTLIGRPLLRPDLVRVEATAVEKSLTHTKTIFRKRRRKNYMRINFCRNHFTIFRINCVRLEGLVDQRPETEGVDGRVF